jgi:hypothetical protein
MNLAGKPTVPSDFDHPSLLHPSLRFWLHAPLGLRPEPLSQCDPRATWRSRPLMSPLPDVRAWPAALARDARASESSSAQSTAAHAAACSRTARSDRHPTTYRRQDDSKCRTSALSLSLPSPGTSIFIPAQYGYISSFASCSRRPRRNRGVHGQSMGPVLLRRSIDRPALPSGDLHSRGFIAGGKWLPCTFAIMFGTSMVTVKDDPSWSIEFCRRCIRFSSAPHPSGAASTGDIIPVLLRSLQERLNQSTDRLVAQGTIAIS